MTWTSVGKKGQEGGRRFLPVPGTLGASPLGGAGVRAAVSWRVPCLLHALYLLEVWLRELQGDGQ